MICSEYQINGLDKKVPYTCLYMGVFQGNIYKNTYNKNIQNFKMNYNLIMIDKNSVIKKIIPIFKILRNLIIKSFILGHFARIFKPRGQLSEKKSQPINIFFIGLDSVSRKDWLQGLPKSSDYLINTMNSHVLNGYNIVGDGTPAALIPILTGKNEEEMPNVMKGEPGSTTVDKAFPFIWKKLEKELQYSTLYNEDWPSSGN